MQQSSTTIIILRPSGAEILNDLLEDLEARGVGFWFAGLKGPVKDRLVDYGLLTGYAVIALLVGWWLFDRLEGRFAEEL